MAYEVQLPRLGWDMEEGVLSAWLKKENEFVQTGDLLFAIEGDKAVQEIEALDTGYLRILPNGPKPGDKAPVGTLLGYLVPEAELASFQLPGSVPAEPHAAAEPVGAVPIAQAASPRDGHRRKIYISPYAKRMAQGLGVDWMAIPGSGLGGRIMAKDVEAAAALLRAAARPAPVESRPEASAAPAAAHRQPMTATRRKIAEHMAHSAHTSAPVTLTSEVDATELVALRQALKADSAGAGTQAPSYNDLLAKLVSQALVEQPAVNARLEGEEIVQLAAVNVAVAVDTDRGLIVPVIKDVQAKSLRQIARESAVLVEKTRSGAVAYEDLQGATFTITNLGMFDIDAFTPIIDLPQCAILGVGRIAPRQVVMDAEAGRVAIRHMVILSLTFDHRLIDGAQAARFLQRVKRFVENPYLWLAG